LEKLVSVLLEKETLEQDEYNEIVGIEKKTEDLDQASSKK
jgi:hypothetical protein